MKTKWGDNPPYELVITATTVVDGDFTLKIKQIEEFVNSKTWLEVNVFAGAEAKEKQCSLFT